MKSGEVFIDREKFETWTEDLAAHRASFLLGRRKHPLSPKKEKPFSPLDCFMLNRTARIQGNVPFLSFLFVFISSFLNWFFPRWFATGHVGN